MSDKPLEVRTQDGPSTAQCQLTHSLGIHTKGVPMSSRMTILAVSLLIVLATSAASFAQSDSAPARFEAVKTALPGVLKSLAETVVKLSKGETGAMTRLQAVPEVVRMTSPSQAKITVTAQWSDYYSSIDKTTNDDGVITLYLRDHSGKWTVTDWECTWSKEKNGRARFHYFAHQLILAIDKLADK